MRTQCFLLPKSHSQACNALQCTAGALALIAATLSSSNQTPPAATHFTDHAQQQSIEVAGKFDAPMLQAF